jgi:hypothetical protein
VFRAPYRVEKLLEILFVLSLQVIEKGRELAQRLLFICGEFIKPVLIQPLLTWKLEVAIKILFTLSFSTIFLA